MLEIAVSLLDKNELDNYSETIKFLINNNEVKFDNSLFAFHRYFIPEPSVRKPLLFLFSKRGNIKENVIFNKTCVIMFHNYVYQLFIPLGKSEIKLNDSNNRIKAIIITPMISQEWIDNYGNPVSSLLSFKETETIKGDEEMIRFKYE